ncbi:MAG TPA: penicillin-binding protein 2 [Solirubrobacteraceae bacterium]|nr:penicillin-binding protein 2 [Solirubrobacteraceae bacterium]
MGLIERRIGLLFAVFLGMLLLAGARAGWLGVVRASSLQDAAATQQNQRIEVPARRGTISDIHGTELAISQPAQTIAATPYLIKDPVAVAGKLARVLGEPQDKLLEKLARRDTGFVYLARRVPTGKAERARKLEIEGLEFIPEFSREYPRDWMASQLLGNVGTEGHGLSGLEYRFDAQLRGRDGERRLVRDALGDTIELREDQRTQPGERVRLTLDANIQDHTEQVLADVGAAWQPRAATALVMDPRDGAILALANWPRVNANRLYEAPESAMMNRAVGAIYEPGSTFKAFTVAGALEDGKVRPTTEFSLPPILPVADREITDAHARGWETRSVAGILAESSNVGAALIGRTLGARRFDEWVRLFGFGTRTGVDLPGEEPGILLDYADYSGSTAANMAMGQGLAVTPMQMAAGYAAIANGGILRPPHIVHSVGGREQPTPKGKRVISEETAAEVRQMLEGVLGPGGTATGAKIDGYELGGKTGTAEKPDENGGYSKTKFVASFVGFAPAKSPQLLVAVMVDEPKGDIYGGTVAGPAFKDITNYALTNLRIAP